MKYLFLLIIFLPIAVAALVLVSKNNNNNKEPSDLPSADSSLDRQMDSSVQNAPSSTFGRQNYVDFDQVPFDTTAMLEKKDESQSWGNEVSTDQATRNHAAVQQVTRTQTETYPSGGPSMSLTPFQLEQVKEQIEQGRLINAVKLVREFSGTGLKEAKGYVDSLRKL